MRDLKMNLKICEGCGALWLRTELKGGVYCVRCTRLLAELPAPRRRGTRPAHFRPQRHNLHLASPAPVSAQAGGAE